MIKGILIENFQAHEKFSLKLDPKVTTIVGPSDVGKSSILRALYWLFFNKPSGQAFIRDNATECRVKSRVDETTIERYRGTENLYRLNGSTYKAFGSDPPDQIAALLNVDEINFQWQHNALFWLSLSPGQVAKELNRIVDLSIMDRVAKSISQRMRRTTAAVDLHSRLLDEAEEEEQGLAWVKDADVDLGKIETLEAGIDEKRAISLSLGRSLDDLKDLKERGELAAAAASAGLRLLERSRGVVEARERVDDLQSLVRRISHQRDVIKYGLREIKTLKSRMPKRCPLCDQPIPAKS